MNKIEDRLLLHPHADQSGNVEEPPVGQPVALSPPIRQEPVLPMQQMRDILPRGRFVDMPARFGTEIAKPAPRNRRSRTVEPTPRAQRPGVSHGIQACHRIHPQLRAPGKAAG